ncbi:FAD-binding oxidoreductase [Streptomyces sp. NPDC005533]|uniref:FAD-binding oxidoreductase n=1 Tax=Streptomyces sp. NPDC005533 TaxID=3364723 RepID=UPI0036BC8E9B
MPDPYLYPDLKAVLEELRQALGAERVRHDAAAAPLPPDPNVSAFAPRDTRAVLRPGSVADVRALVGAFHHAKASGAELPGLQPVSTGRNWGLGSKEPAAGPVVRVELDELDALRTLDTEAGYAVVEPGVTQKELSELLAGTGRMLNVTASSGHTSVLGNTVDRGVGLRHQRTEDLLGLEVVLPDGAVAHIGWWPGDAAHGKGDGFNPLGLGPSLLHLFTQSDLGIVTAAVVRLLPRPQRQSTVRAGFHRETLHRAVDALRVWKANGLIAGVIKVYDTASTATYGGGDTAGGYVAHLSVEGTERSAAALKAALLAEMAETGLFTSVTSSDEEPPADGDVVAHVVHAAYSGSVAHNERMLASATGATAERVDADGNGWLFFLPFLPFDGAAVVRALDILDRIHLATGIRPGSTVNALDADVIDLVVSFPFDRGAQTGAAHRALDLAHLWFGEAGLRPYRLDSGHARAAAGTADTPETALQRALRAAVDPHGVMAAGRYA